MRTYLRDSTLDQIGPEVQQAFVTRIAPKVAKKTLLNVLGTLSAIMTKAGEWKYLCEPVRIQSTNEDSRSAAPLHQMSQSATNLRFSLPGDSLVVVSFLLGFIPGQTKGSSSSLRRRELTPARANATYVQYASKTEGF